MSDTTPPTYRVMLIPELSPRSTYPRFRYLTVQIRLGRRYLIIDPEGWWRWRRTLVKVYDGTTTDRHDYR